MQTAYLGDGPRKNLPEKAASIVWTRSAVMATRRSAGLRWIPPLSLAAASDFKLMIRETKQKMNPVAATKYDARRCERALRTRCLAGPDNGCIRLRRSPTDARFCPSATTWANARTGAPVPVTTNNASWYSAMTAERAA